MRIVYTTQRVPPLLWLINLSQQTRKHCQKILSPSAVSFTWFMRLSKFVSGSCFWCYVCLCSFVFAFVFVYLCWYIASVSLAQWLVSIYKILNTFELHLMRFISLSRPKGLSQHLSQLVSLAMIFTFSQRQLKLYFWFIMQFNSLTHNSKYAQRQSDFFSFPL